MQLLFAYHHYVQLLLLSRLAEYKNHNFMLIYICVHEILHKNFIEIWTPSTCKQTKIDIFVFEINHQIFAEDRFAYCKLFLIEYPTHP